MIAYDFRVHWAGVFLFILLLMLVLVIASRAIEVNRPYLCDRCKRQCANEENSISIHIKRL